MTYKDEQGSIVVENQYPGNTIPLPFIKPSEVHEVVSENGFKTKYVKVNISLDIETTKVYTDEGVRSVPYIISVCISKPGEDVFYVYHMKTWQDTQKLLNEIAEKYGLGAKHWNKNAKKYVKNKGFKSRRTALCWIHNASYEFAFCRTELSFAGGEYGFFSKDSRKMMKADLANGIQFRDSMALTNSSLQQLSKMYTKHKKEKDLDYDKPRHTSTPLTDKERRYINEDVIILCEFGTVFWERFCIPGKTPPLTNTARLLQKTEQRMIYSGYDIQDTVKQQPTVSDVLQEQKYLFRGGLVHANSYYIDRKVMCLMRDITSSYPASMLMEYMPITKFKPVQLSRTVWAYGDEPADFIKLLKSKAVKMTVTYVGLHAITDHTYESRSKLMEWIPPVDDPTQGLDNGRIRQAELVKTMHTELDYEAYTYLYKWDAMEVHEIKVADRGRLPEFLLSGLREAYTKKNDLKVQGLQDTMDYALAKVDANTYFGMCCKSVYDKAVGYDWQAGQWVDKPVDIEDLCKEFFSRFVCYSWGEWIAGQSRVKLVRAIIAIEKAGGHVVYYDTDSIKYIPSGDGKTEQAFEDMNDIIRAKRMTFPDLTAPAFNGKSGKGLGEWDPECKNLLVDFKTLGAKRYLYDDGKEMHLCVAGLPKSAQKLLPEESENAFELFSLKGFCFKGEDTGKLRPEYHDEPYTVTVTDEYGTSEQITCKSGVSLVPVDFDITEEKLYTISMQVAQYRKERRAV